MNTNNAKGGLHSGVGRNMINMSRRGILVVLLALMPVIGAGAEPDGEKPEQGKELEALKAEKKALEAEETEIINRLGALHNRKHQSRKKISTNDEEIRKLKEEIARKQKELNELLRERHPEIAEMEEKLQTLIEQHREVQKKIYEVKSELRKLTRKKNK